MKYCIYYYCITFYTIQHEIPHAQKIHPAISELSEPHVRAKLQIPGNYGQCVDCILEIINQVSGCLTISLYVHKIVYKTIKIFFSFRSYLNIIVHTSPSHQQPWILHFEAFPLPPLSWTDLIFHKSDPL